MNLTRREMLRTTALGTVAALAVPRMLEMTAQADAAAVPALPTVTTMAADYATLQPLPYAVDALEPFLDAQTMQIHHDKHHATYVKNLNAAMVSHPDLRSRTAEDLVAHWSDLPAGIQAVVRNQGGGHVNHAFFWPSLTPGGSAPAGEFAKAVEQTFGGLDPLRDQLVKAGLGVFGSGWAWLILNGDGKLAVVSTPNQDSPLSQGQRPLLGLDVWEHAYYLKYQNRRAEYLEAIFRVINWDLVSGRFAEPRT